MLSLNQEEVINLIENIKKGDRESYNKLVEFFNTNKDIMIPGVAKSLKKSINYAKRYLI